MANRLVISAPFGNIFRMPHAISTLGTYTTSRRAGFWKRWWRVLRTVCYYPGIGAWKNKLGLPNPGIASLLFDRDAVTHDKIISVAGHDLDDWKVILASAAMLNPLLTEMNVSCPNCPGEDRSDYVEVFPAVVKRVGDFHRLVVKIPPVGYATLVRQALDAGIRGFHCCNTIPTPAGGISGKPLQPFALEAVSAVRDVAGRMGYKISCLIGGGGVTHQADADRFLSAGATHVAVASVLFNPLNWCRVARMAEALATHE